MTETLTESFCERCGTRYTFETLQRTKPLGRLGTIGRGLKHFVVMSDASLDEAMAVARSEDEARVTTAQLEAFHRTFNFCLQCRQYTCTECWNAVEGRCLTCAPMPVEERPSATQATVGGAVRASLLANAPDAPPRIHVAEASAAVPVTESAPTIEILPTPRREPEPAWPEPPVEVAQTPIDSVVEEEVEAEVERETEIEVEPETVAEAAASAAHMEPAVADVELEPVEVDPMPAVAEAAPAVAEPAPPEPTATASAPTTGHDPGAAPFPGFRPGRSLDDEIAAYELRIAALATPPPMPEPPLPAEAVHRAPDPAPAPHATSAARLGAALAADGPEPAAGAADLLPAPTPGTCLSCGLSISSSARFCRRCGARQEA